jgi:hypothetical protein
MQDRFDMEKIFRIYDGKFSDTEYLEIGEDADGLGMIEFRLFSMETNKILDRMSIDIEEVPLVVKAILEVAKDLEEKKTKNQKT